MAGCVGDDQLGRDLVAGLRRDRACVVMRCRRAALPTGTTLITVDAEGADPIVVISAPNAACDTGLVDRALAGAGGPGILHLQHEIPEPTNAHAIRLARAAGWFVVLNPAPARPVMPALLQLIDVVAPNETEGGGAYQPQRPMPEARRLVAQGNWPIKSRWAAGVR